LDRGLGPNLGTELEAIRYGFGRTVDAKLHPIERMNLDTKVKGRPGEVCDSNGGKVDLGSLGTSFDRKPYLGRILRSQLVATKRGGEAKNALGHSLCKLNVDFLVGYGRTPVPIICKRHAAAAGSSIRSFVDHVETRRRRASSDSVVVGANFPLAA